MPPLPIGLGGFFIYTNINYLQKVLTITNYMVQYLCGLTKKYMIYEMGEFKMNQEEREAIQKLLEKIPENELSKAVGGLSSAAKKAFALAGIISAGAAVGFVGTWGIWSL